ncbi:hypothetical protein TanjilG_04080 [Lupinus angustifolius]|uniref:RING-type E3 ubiquitin transferase n=1 Tax=Lupinus angustifolius TaxID=3871 RepID=A0A394C6G3_LUPAN|nr:PREDICTED: U-box domain-containing protein 40-like [Lupinus angustifolius]XP_019452902.1 PREDICTED: U-box domain-containing protein 40-like [Lupinus angustifolius]OIW06684.1 hypothetical protein TanjilG_04078 [Lupinus angustifolius]OIW06686.1 hypothetical protein TanjilG_04080 [Lupinus angustifolius]
MEIQQTLKLLVHRKNTHNKKSDKLPQPITPRFKWKQIFFHHTKSQQQPPSKPNNKITEKPPEEFLCPITKTLMSDPVIVSSGHSFDRITVQTCQNLNFTPQLLDGTTPDFSNVIPNLALKSAITKWCINSNNTLVAPDSTTTENIIHAIISKQSDQNQNVPTQVATVSEKDLILRMEENPNFNFNRAETQIPNRPALFYSTSDESIATNASASASTPPLQFSIKPSCYYSYSSNSSSEIEPTTIPELEQIISNLKSPQIFIIEEGLISLRKITRTREEIRVSLCTSQLLSVLKSLIVSKYTNVQVNALASVVNLSLEKLNKVKIVRSGIVPPLIEVLRLGSSESQELASGALFSLAIEHDNKTAIGVLGGLQPLLHALRSESERTRHDSALALYHLSMVQSNMSKMVKFGSVPVLMMMVESGHMISRVLLILCNLGSGSDGRAAMLDAGVVECLVGLLGGSELGIGSTRESCVSVMYALSHGGLRFKALAKAAGVVEVLQKVEKVGSERAREKVRRILEMMRGKEEEEEDVDWEDLLDSGLGCRTRGRHCSELDDSNANSSEF